jgi:2-polyprenyl-6-hydroxyphenyl methylase/3-demethylubiquinone-9 3-methyltransferase
MPQLFPTAKWVRSPRPCRLSSGKKGDVLTVEFTVAGVHCIGLNGGPLFKHSEAFSFQIATDDQAETDRLWNAIVKNGGQRARAAGARTNGALVADHPAPSPTGWPIPIPR